MVWDISDAWKRRMGIVAKLSKMATGTQIVLEVKKNN